MNGKYIITEYLVVPENKIVQKPKPSQTNKIDNGDIYIKRAQESKERKELLKAIARKR